MSKRPPHPPLKLDAARIKRVADAARKGKPRRLQAASAGVSRTTLQKWMQKGQPITPVDEHGKPLPDADPVYPDTPYGRLVAAVDAADAEWEFTMLQEIEAAANGTHTNRFGEAQHQWQAAAWLLERRNPDEYARTERSKVELTGKDGGAVEVIERASRDLTSRLASLTARIRATGDTPDASSD